MGGYLKRSKLMGLSEFLTGGNKLHLPGELCVVSDGCKERRKRKTLVGNKSLQKLQEQKMKT